MTRIGTKTAGQLTALGLSLLLGAPALAQDGDGMEEFEEIDPYTKGDRELMDRLGYVSFGPFHWRDGDSTTQVQVHMGDMPVLWVETEHFRIGSSLPTYKLGGDRDEKKAIEEELDRLKERLGKLKAKAKTLDPWLRLHLYAQRCEELYAAFQEDFGLEPADYEDAGPYLGRKDKFMVLLCERGSEYSRHLDQYLDVQTDQPYRWLFPNGPAFVGINMERIRSMYQGDDARPNDAILYGQLTSWLTSSFVEGFRGGWGRSPYWLTRSYGHFAVRRIDPRWVTGIGTRDGQTIDQDDYKWEPRVKNLVKNEFYASTSDMFGWLGYEEMNVRDHMVAWSKLHYLLTEVEGDHSGFLLDLNGVAPVGGDAESQRESQVRAQRDSLIQHFDLTPEELDEAWDKHVSKHYPKR